ncbi:uncharacterized protein LOC121872417 isoform X2 [Homarus americanus]|nr:uncharacterized protein LOC121872417 isoform X2 [Homarus americanus]XP_042231113.1 uncharacterized protein LOC121872417 isoform X2 [Homarus americanus]XP_042231121.1 uncharacterized protein LOC121872417 isoform X2 [Homarus americanus]XP_042231130.1 uncharacterized protein LOC121872417 isoform X2 [Homarus americanus]
MAGGVCPFTLTRELLYHTFLTGVVLLLVVTQGILLDVYILSNDHTAIKNYFWLIPDFLLIFAFVAAMSSGYKSCKHERSSKENPKRSDAGHRRGKVPIHVKMLGLYSLPVFVWLAYSGLLVAKVVIIFKSEIPNKISTSDALSPQLLKIVLSLTFVIFALLVEGQTMTEANSERKRYIQSLSHGTAFEILDSVTFLSLIIQPESKLVLPLHLENAVIAFSSMNFIFPAIALVKLSRSNYGHSPLCLVSSITYKMCHLWLINFTYFVIRIYLLAGISLSVSPFIVKNLYHIFSIMKSVWVDFKQLRLVMGDYFDKRRRVYTATEATGGASLNTGNSSNDWTSVSDKFEEIDLKHDA